MVNLMQSFLKDESGLSMTESLMTIPIVIILMGAMVEFGVMMNQFAQTAKATQVGARLAAVSDPVASAAAMGALIADYPANSQGDPAPDPGSSPVSVVCGAGAAACDTTELARLLTGGDGVCGQVTNGIRGICDVAPFIAAENIRVSYHRSGLGYIGRPDGPVATITVETRNLTFDFLILDRIITALTNIAIPAHPVSITSEDLSSCKGTCP
ncbi:MAG: hypothetical protein JXQ97_15700 [Natronospirillum sp.]